MGLFTFTSGLLIVAVIFLIISVIVCIFTAIARLLKFISNIIIIHKGDGNWWKGIIPFYNRWVRYHLAFDKKRALIVFIADMIISGILGVIGIVMFIATCTANIVESSKYYIQSYDAWSRALGDVFIISLIAIMLVKMVYSLVYRYGTYGICKAFGRENGFCIAALFIPVIASSIVAFSNDIYMEDVGETRV